MNTSNCGAASTSGIWPTLITAAAVRCRVATAAWMALTMPFAASAGEPAQDDGAAMAYTELRYDIKVAWIDAGEIAMQLSREGDRYALLGTVATSRLMDRFFKWHGRFVSIGRFEGGFPHTNTYMLWGEGEKKRETVISSGGATTIQSSDGGTREVPQPPGSDLMAVTFLAPHCLQETTLHDGEHLYRLRLEHSVARESLPQRRHYYSAPSQRCDYRFTYSDGSTRRLSLWIGTWQDRRMPVRLRVRVPLLPDGNVFLRTSDPAGQRQKR